MKRGSKHTKEALEKIRSYRHSEEQLKKMRANRKENIGKLGLHRRMDSRYGKPKYCELCKRIDKKKYEWANKDHKYSEELKDWMRLCTSCHRKFDIENNNYSGFWWNSTEIHPTKK